VQAEEEGNHDPDHDAAAASNGGNLLRPMTTTKAIRKKPSVTADFQSMTPYTLSLKEVNLSV
jgi:hypothetical protein